MTQEDLEDGLFRANEPAHFKPPPTKVSNFFAWHKVRKQYIRSHQWNHETYGIVSTIKAELERGENDGTVGVSSEGDNLSIERLAGVARPLRCLCLPGNDFLDIRALSKALAPRKYWIRFAGFNQAVSSPQNSATDVLQDLIPKIDHVTHSKLIRGKFQSIADTNTQAFCEFKKWGPYDVVNIDLCDSILPWNDPKIYGEYLQAIRNLIEFQRLNQKSQWLFFITSKIDPTEINTDLLSRFAKPTMDNVSGSEKFNSDLSEFVAMGPDQTKALSSQFPTLPPAISSGCLSIFHGKWMLSFLHKASPSWSVELLKSYRYIIEPIKGIQILSMAFKIIPNHSLTEDTTGLTESKVMPRHPLRSETDCALQILKAATEIPDVDEILKRQHELRNKMLAASIDLMLEAGHDQENYLKWLKENDPLSDLLFPKQPTQVDSTL